MLIHLLSRYSVQHQGSVERAQEKNCDSQDCSLAGILSKVKRTADSGVVILSMYQVWSNIALSISVWYM